MPRLPELCRCNRVHLRAVEKRVATGLVKSLVRRAADVALSLRLPAIAIVMVAGCAAPPPEPTPSVFPVPATPDEARALIAKVLPPPTTSRAGWATDIYAAMAVLEIAPSIE